MEDIPGKSVSALRSCLLDLTQPIAKRTHAAFFLRTLATDDAMRAILEGQISVLDSEGFSYFYVPAAIQVREDSSLMRHELGYILGQLRNAGACETLTHILSDESEDLLVRHEVMGGARRTILYSLIIIFDSVRRGTRRHWRLGIDTCA